jgi:putative acetyltransferase
MDKTILIRTATSADYRNLAEAMFDAIWNGPSFYTQEQCRAWCPEIPGGQAWDKRLSEQTIYLAEQGSVVMGFMSLVSPDYIDFAYIRPDFQKTGLFRRLFVEIEKQARLSNAERLWTHASLMARPAFAAMGFDICEPETVERSGEKLKRFKMQKTLG